ncbi:MAG: phosphonate metabolism protein/1,5-bisphosphokinase (PRPP-forming) PhnN, partial [Desulfovibrio sp.]
MRGRLIYVMGPSGSGKDSLMSGLLAAYPDAGLVAARRYITRPESAGGEAHVSVTPERFAELSENGAFCMQWQSHG